MTYALNKWPRDNAISVITNILETKGLKVGVVLPYITSNSPLSKFYGFTCLDISVPEGEMPLLPRYNNMSVTENRRYVLDYFGLLIPLEKQSRWEFQSWIV